MSARFVVVNNYKPVTEGVMRVNCMRRSSGGTVFGNPYSMNKGAVNTKIERDRVCDLFQKHLEEVVEKKQGSLYNGLRELYKAAKAMDGDIIELSCCCSPKRCHADSIAAFLNAKLGV